MVKRFEQVGVQARQARSPHVVPSRPRHRPISFRTWERKGREEASWCALSSRSGTPPTSYSIVQGGHHSGLVRVGSVPFKSEPNRSSR